MFHKLINMHSFESTILVTKDDIDDLNHVNNVRYVQWVQDIAKQHWLKHAPVSILENYFWVMLSHYIEYKNSALLHDTLKLKTYILNFKGATCMRIVEISKNDVLIVKSETKWCLMNTKSKRPVRITEEIAELFE